MAQILLTLFALSCSAASCSARLKTDKDMTEKVTRKHKHIKIYVLPEEFEIIEKDAARTGMSQSQYGRRVLLGSKIKQTSDDEILKALAGINNDLARYGNLMKLWLTHDDRVQWFGKKHIEQVLANTESVHDEVKAMMKTVAGKFR